MELRCGSEPERRRGRDRNQVDEFQEWAAHSCSLQQVTSGQWKTPWIVSQRTRWTKTRQKYQDNDQNMDDKKLCDHLRLHCTEKEQMVQQQQKIKSTQIVKSKRNSHPPTPPHLHPPMPLSVILNQVGRTEIRKWPSPCQCLKNPGPLEEHQHS